MMKISSVAVPAAIVLVLAGCASADVRTATAPDAYLTSLRTFDLLKQPAGAPAQGSNDPMLVNSMSNRALRADLVKGFEDRGYVRSHNPDFLVAYYASGKKRLDVTHWNYDYTFGLRWLGPGPDWGTETTVATQYPHGTVLIDVVDPRTHEVIWRGEGIANVSDDERQYEQDLRKTVSAILQKFPPPRMR